MVSVEDYQQFGGNHWETSSVRHVLAHKGILNPHTNLPFTEAMIFGLTGGITAMYFTFEYEGYPPQLIIGTRYPFDPIFNVIERLGLIPNVIETTSQKRAVDNLLSELATGEPAIVWADMFQLRYNGQPASNFPGMLPIVVYAYDSESGLIKVADRSSQPLSTNPGELSQARAAQQNMENRILAIGIPENGLKDLRRAVAGAIEACAELYTGKPPRGPAINFGLSALDKWADLVCSEKKKGWLTLFADPALLYDALKSVYKQIEHSGNGGGASRPTYADFLDEAALVLNNSKLEKVADQFRDAGEQWMALANAAFPEDIPAFQETRELIDRREHLFVEHGEEALPELDQITARLRDIEQQVGRDAPLQSKAQTALLADLQKRILGIREVEAKAVAALTKAL